MTTVAQFAKMVVDAGQGVFMDSSDLKDTYKMIPVTLEQRKLQAYSFCGALFIELKLIFGDKLACQYFDKFHYAILHAFVYPAPQSPPVAQGRTVDDIPLVVPFNAKDSLITFVKEYTNSLEALDINRLMMTQPVQRLSTAPKRARSSAFGSIPMISHDPFHTANSPHWSRT